MSNTGPEVALVKRACRVCFKTVDAEIVMNTKLIESNANKVSDMHGKVIGWIDNDLGMCDECLKDAKKGVYFITVDESKTEDRDNPWRTGGLFMVKNKAVKEMLKGTDILDKALENRIVFIPDDLAEQVGFPMDYKDESKNS